MRKLKTISILAMTLCLIVLCAALPMLVAALQDRTAQNGAGYTDLKSVALELSAQSENLSIVEKLILLKSGDSYTISEKEATRTASEILSFAQKHIELYMNAGIFIQFEASNFQVVPALCIDSNQQTHCVIWAVFIVNRNDEGENLTVIVDDETGIILSIAYETYYENAEISYMDRDYLMDAFWNIYLSQLELQPGRNDVDVAPNYEEPGDGSLRRYFYTADPEGRELVIGLEISPYGGFATYFS